MKSFLILSQLVFLITFSSLAQSNWQVSGKLIDSLHNEKPTDATISLMNAKDSSLIAFTRTDSAGKFSFKNLGNGEYRLSASHANFHTSWRNFTVNGNNVDLGDVLMIDKSVLSAVNIVAQRPPVVVNGDTLEFNAEAFKTKPNAVVEDMLKKMPGVEIDKDGTVRVNGKRISRVLVNGKDFFNGDPTVATRNLSADAIDKVQVFDKQSDQSAFTGVDDGNSEKAINLKLKKDKVGATFGKAAMAAGTDSRFDGRFNVNKFKGEQQLSSIGMANNVNKQGFGFMDVMNFTGQNKKMMRGGGGIVINTDGPEDFGVPVSGQSDNPQGINTTIAGGINFNNNWKKKTDVNGSYFYNNIMSDNQRTVLRKNLLQGNNYTYNGLADNKGQTISNRFNVALDQSIDSFNSLKITSVDTYQQGNLTGSNQFLSLSENKDTLNNGNSKTISANNGYNLVNTFLFKHKFSKKGRTLSFNGQFQLNDSRNNGSFTSLNNFYSSGVKFRQDTLDQTNNLKSITQSYGATITYTEPLSKKALLEFRTFYNYGSGNLDKITYDLNHFNGKYDMRNQLLSNSFVNEYNSLGGGVSFRGLKKKINYSAGVNIQSDNLNSHIKDSAFSIANRSVNVLPLATLNYNLTKYKSLRFDYNTSVTQPSSYQLQPVKDVSDPLNIKIGNPGLSQSYSHNLGLQYFYANPGKGNNLLAFVNYAATQNAIVSNETLNNLGERTTSYTNANGNYNIFGVVDKSMNLKKLKTRITVGGNISFNHSVNFINAQKDQSGNLSFTPRLSLNYTFKDLIDFSAGGRWAFNNVKYSLEPSLNNNYLKQTYTFDGNLNLPSGFNFNTDLSYTVNRGRTDGFNKNSLILNASLAKQVFKSKKGEIKVSAYNFLNQNVGIDRNAAFNYIEDISYKTLKPYYTFGFTYSLQKSSNTGPRATIRTF